MEEKEPVLREQFGVGGDSMWEKQPPLRDGNRKDLGLFNKLESLWLSLRNEG